MDKTKEKLSKFQASQKVWVGGLSKTTTWSGAQESHCLFVHEVISLIVLNANQSICDRCESPVTVKSIRKTIMACCQEAESAERSEELKTLAEAKKILSANGMDQAEGRLSELQQPVSFLQVNVQQFPTRQLQAATYLRQEGQRLQSWVLAQVGDRLAADPFAKVKDMIQQMVEKLLEEQAAESEHKEWCDKESTKTASSKDLKSDRVDELSTRLDKAKADSAELSREVSELAKEIQALDNAMKEAVAMRQKESSDFAAKKADYEQGQTACAAAIKVLREYYEGKSFVQTATLDMSRSTAAQPNAASGIIGLLEVAESDFSRMLAEATAQEDAAAAEFDTFSQDSKVSKASKEAESKNKAAERQRVESTISETATDHEDASKELAAVQEYEDKLKASCDTKAPSFEEREQRRKSEIEGLQTALSILDGKDIALTQTRSGLRH